MTRWRKAPSSGGAGGRLFSAVGALPAGRYLLAVSGGRDSMVLLDAFAAARSDAVGVATFDHGTGSAATAAARLVAEESAARGIPVVAGRSRGGLTGGESSWRAARWAFLSREASALAATVVTAHTRDDQLETVILRALRDSRTMSARGLAAMYAPSSVARPLIGVSREEVAAFARDREVRWVEDPSNANLRHGRNRVRHELLPALERVRPGFGTAMLAISRRAAAWRASVEDVVDLLGVRMLPPLVVPAAAFDGLSDRSVAVLWPAIAARGGVTLDWRGTERLVFFTRTARPGARMPLAGGASVHRTAATFLVRAPAAQ